MRLKILFYFLLIQSTFLAQGYVPISDSNFLNALKKVVPSVIVNNQLDTSSAKKIYNLNISNYNISDINEIKYFSQLRSLNCNNNKLKLLNIYSSYIIDLNCSKNELDTIIFFEDTLKYLTTFSCSFNNLRFLPNFYANRLEILHFQNNQIEDVSLVNLFGKSLISLDCSFNKLKSLELNFNIGTTLKCSNNVLSSLILSSFHSYLDSIDFSNNNVTNFTFSSQYLKFLNCSNNQLISLNISNLIEIKYIDCSQNKLSFLDLSKSSELLYLNCSFNSLNSINILKCLKLQKLNCSNNVITSIDLQGLKYIQDFNCSHNQIKNIFNIRKVSYLDIPTSNFSSLSIDCSYNSIESLPDIRYARGVFSLNCSNNKLKKLPFLTSTLSILDCSNNQINSLTYSDYYLYTFETTNGNYIFSDSAKITKVPSLPRRLEYLNISNNQISEIANLPESLIGFDCSNNNLYCLPKLPKSLKKVSRSMFDTTMVFKFDISNNYFTCLPNYIPAMDSNDLKYPLCTYQSNVNNCFIDNNLLEGKIEFDQNNNCNTGESLKNVTVNLVNNKKKKVDKTITYSNGYYQFELDSLYKYDSLFVEVDSTHLPFKISCLNKVDTLIKSTSDSLFVSKLNSFYTCKDSVDLGIKSISTQGIVFPGQQHHVNVFAGETSAYYGQVCSKNIGGQVEITVNGPVKFIKEEVGALKPKINKNTLLFYISDFSKVNFEKDFDLIFQVDTTAQSSDEICIDARISNLKEDTNKLNNYLSYCYYVRNSHDPNFKEVYPANFQNNYNDYFLYTIHFQNTGSNQAFNVKLIDTLDSKFDLNTFEVVNFSHPNQYHIYNNTLIVKFNDIFLSDSTSNEKESHGFIQFKIKPKFPLSKTDNIDNTSYIYFDYNSPVKTNVTRVSIEKNSQIYGAALIDKNQNCKIDSTDIKLKNIKVNLFDSLNQLVQTTSTNNQGDYFFKITTSGRYSLKIDTLNLPLKYICSSNSLLDFNESTNFINNNFYFECKEQIDFGIFSVKQIGDVLPGKNHLLKIAAGDNHFYNGIGCSKSVFGKLIVKIDDNVKYKGVPIGAITPIVSGNIISYEGLDFSKIDCYKDFEILLELDSNSKTKNCVEVSISSDLNEVNLANNSMQYCYDLTNNSLNASKEVHPSECADNYDDFIYYSINFKNTLPYIVQNVSIVDYLDDRFDIQSLKIINSSHPYTYSLKSNVLNVNLDHLNLDKNDSTNNSGFVQFKIKLTKPLQLNNFISNKAIVNFDQNAYQTNSVRTSVITKTNALYEISDDFKIFPNPTENIVEISCSSSKIKNVNLVTLEGQIIQIKNLNGTNNHFKLDLTSFDSGIYFVEVETELSKKRFKISKL